MIPKLLSSLAALVSTLWNSNQWIDVVRRPDRLALAETASTTGTKASELEIHLEPGGSISVTELGNPPLGMEGPEARAIARSNALARAREQLIKAIRELKLPDGRTVDLAIRQDPKLIKGLKGLLGNAVVRGSELAGDVAEVTLTVPLDGPEGLQRFLDSLSP